MTSRRIALLGAVAALSVLVAKGRAEVAISVVKNSVAPVTGDGEATAFEGAALTATYAILAVFTLCG